jgi:hypothetical protein
MMRREKTAATGRKNEPRYARYALLNPYNLSLLAGAGITTLATGGWWLAICASVAETLWLLYAPDSRLLQRVWFDKMWEAERKAEAEARLKERIAELGASDAARVLMLREQCTRIGELAKESPSFASDVMRPHLAKLDGLLDDFADLAGVVARCERHLSTFDVPALRRAYGEYSAQMRLYSVGDTRHEVASKNLEVLQQRKVRWEELGGTMQTARGQMELIENTLRLLADEIVSMGNPTELGPRLDELRFAVDAIRETVDPAERTAAKAAKVASFRELS